MKFSIAISVLASITSAAAVEKRDASLETRDFDTCLACILALGPETRDCAILIYGPKTYETLANCVASFAGAQTACNAC